ncbi:MAG: hypothetical protein HRT57_11910 [Crocinitomicaceae bacterium]|nr:hypothetical protein [Crocinitomicaceae bacterium]
MKLSLLLFKFVFIGAFLFVTSCGLNSEDERGNKDPELLERADREKRRREDNLLRQEFRDEYYDEDEDEDYYDTYSSTYGGSSSNYDISSNEQVRDNKWRESDYHNYEGYFEYGYASQALEGSILIEYVGLSYDYPSLSVGQNASKIEQSYHLYFSNHPASGFSCKKIINGRFHEITKYETRTKGSKYVDVEAIYSVDVDGEKFIIVIENGGQTTADFLNNYEDFIEDLLIVPS